MAQHWVDGFSILREETVKVPVGFVVYIHGSNGMAAGNTIEEAIIQASCEIFERHVQIQIIKHEKTVPSIPLDSVNHLIIKDMVKFYRENKVDVAIKDLSLDGLLPSIGVLFVNNNLRPDRLEHRILIPGASFNLDDGLIRCFTESMQGRETLSAPRPQLDRPIVHRSRVNNFYLLMKCGVAAKDISFLERGETKDYESKTIKDVLGEIEEIKRICREFNTDCVILNQTHPAINFPVVRVVIPRVSDFLPFLQQDILVNEATRPAATWRGEEFTNIMDSFFP
jgi:YcaO-like protein with predicted kinase domain